jgi:Protein of unknown function (DUF2442)
MLPPKLLQGLKDATAAQLHKVELTPLGTGLHWEGLDADLSVAGLAAGVFGSNAWMSELARQAGSRTTVRKAISSRENGKRGGRPRLRKFLWTDARAPSERIICVSFKSQGFATSVRFGRGEVDLSPSMCSCKS